MKPGPRPKGAVRIEWSPQFAYAIGLLTADGCLSKDGRHIDLTSKDKPQITLFKKCLGLCTKTSKKYSGNGNLSYRTQFGDVLFYRFLVGLGLSPAKSNRIISVKIPDEYFFDFVRGYFDGDGSSYSYFDPKFPKSYRFYISFTSGSREYLHWLKRELVERAGISGYISLNRNNSYIQLKYAKKSAMALCAKMYYKEWVPCLQRKRSKIDRALRINNSGRSGEIGRRAAFRAQ